MKIRPVEAEFLHADGSQAGIQTDRHDEANSGFSQSGEQASKLLGYTVRMMQVSAVIFVSL